jgi:hypothetical protein
MPDMKRYNYETKCIIMSNFPGAFPFITNVSCFLCIKQTSRICTSLTVLEAAIISVHISSRVPCNGRGRPRRDRQVCSLYH